MRETGRLHESRPQAGQLTRRQALGTLCHAAAALGCGGFSAARAAGAAGTTERGRLAEEIERLMWDKVLAAWYPRCLDTDRGGFYENFSRDWTRGPTESKFLVYQARQTWVAAAVALAYPQQQQREKYLQYARHGLRFLADKMWDARHGGFFDRTDAAGQPIPDKMPWKQLYSYAFGIYAAAAVSEATGDREAMKLGQAAFEWLDEHAHDAQCGGYFEHLTAEGRPVAMDVPQEPLGEGLPVIGQVGYKSMNAHIHLLEALTALRRVWDDSRLTARLQEVFEIVRDKIVLPGGHLNMFAARDFKPHDQRSSFGHQLEIAYLLEEAAECAASPGRGRHAPPGTSNRRPCAALGLGPGPWRLLRRGPADRRTDADRQGVVGASRGPERPANRRAIGAGESRVLPAVRADLGFLPRPHDRSPVRRLLRFGRAGRKTAARQ